MKQLSFFNQEDNETSLNIKVRLSKDCVWEAEISNGWWIAKANSKEQAIKKVIEAFMRDC